MSDNCQIEVPAWELSKENVVPIKKGRSAKGLGEKLSTNENNVGNLTTTQESTFEKDLASENNATLLLDIYTRYIKWIQDNNPTTTDKTLKLYEV